MSAPLRVGRIVALNMYPIYHHLERLADRRFAFTDGLPAALNAAVLDGRLDVSAMSSIEYARNARRLELLPVASISALGAVDSIQVFSNVPFAEIRTVSVTPHSATSVSLLRVLLGPRARFEVLASDPREALRRTDAVLLIADEALISLRDGIAAYQTDLGERWFALTGLPMVFAVWAARRAGGGSRRDELTELASLLTEAQDRFAADPAPVVAAAAERFPVPPAYIAEYFARLAYGFAPQERAGLTRFFELARECGELDTIPALAA